ncbi:hypothetical protein TIFTF001_031693 [Ficus carica]|uniref:Uncharacterized protein n=1 Tax=Ficus carica TaxID=3494 RepID=A0AA88DVG8_FICCA|nr:hypothetical protein TIFTF001_031693 [Ficus carica]
MLTNDKSHEQVFKYDSKQVALCRTDPLQVGFGPWFELDWTGRPNHSMAARHGKQPVKKCMIQDCGDGAVDCEIWVGHRHAF